MTYECKLTFSSKNGKCYRSGEAIGENEFLKLDGWERNNFRPMTFSKQEDEDDDSTGILGTAIAIASIFDNFTSNDSPSSSDSGNGFDGFGGGDSGGAGSTGDW